MPGTPAPGTNQNFGLLVTPTLSDGGHIAFRAALSGSGQWPLRRLVGPDGHADRAGRPGTAGPGAAWVPPSSADQLHPRLLNAAGQIAFSGDIATR